MSEQTPVDPLIAQAVKKAAVIWVAIDTAPAKALWCTWAEPGLLVVCGEGEQHDPGFAEVSHCEVIARGDHNGRIVSFEAEVTAVTPESADWTETATALAAKRLNSTAPDTVAAWASGCSVYRLTPSGDRIRSGGRLPAESLAAPPGPSAAARPTRKPFRLHKVKKRAAKR